MEHVLPLVSVLIPAYNHEQFILECLDSVGAQEGVRMELLVIDDGSSDGTARVAEAWIERSSHHFERAEIRSRPNQGICSTLNELVAWSTGDYACLLASDDALLPRGVASRVDYLEDHPLLEAVMSDVQLMDDAGNVLATSALEAYGYRKKALRTNQLLGLFLSTWTPPFSHQFFRAEWLRRNPYPSGLGYEDYYTALRLGRDRRIGFLPTTTVRYRVASGRNQGRLPVTDLVATHAATIRDVFGDGRQPLLVALARARATRTMQRDGRADHITRLLHLLVVPQIIRHRRLSTLWHGDHPHFDVPKTPTAVLSATALS